MITPQNQQAQQIREQFDEADAISRLEGYSPTPFELEERERVISGEIDTDAFISILAAHVLALPSETV